MALLKVDRFVEILAPPTEAEAEELAQVLLTFADTKTIANVLKGHGWDVVKELEILIGFAEDEELRPTARMKAMDQIRAHSLGALKADGRLMEVIERIRHNIDGTESVETTAIRQITKKMKKELPDG